MSLFNRTLASLGVGSARVDARLEKSSFEPGEEVRGVVHIEGGKVDQQIDHIYMYVKTQYTKESNDKKVRVTGVVGKFRVSEPFFLKAGEKRDIPFSFLLPCETPVTQGRTPVWIETGLDIPSAVDPKDTDGIEVIPNPLQKAVLDAVAELGFRLRKIDCEHSYLRSGHPFAQEFEFVPASGPFKGYLDELEVVFAAVDPDQTEVFMQIDKKARGLFGVLEESAGRDERYARFTVKAEDVKKGVLAGRIQSIIRHHLN
ncbi:MAG: sporulation protein [Dethiobacter sp.]|jgi:sporulation-control protein|nr:sporulation protein [Dethiobacter sp.]